MDVFYSIDLGIFYFFNHSISTGFLDKFFSIIAHDLKNQFSGIMMGAETLLNSFDKAPPEKIKNKIVKVNSYIKNTYSLFENLLIWARLQKESIEYNPELFLLNEVINNNINLSEVKADQKGVKLLSDLNEEKTICRWHIYK